ncbi:heteropolysaccharide repeat-containing protein, partial [mine drainage metagenome]
NIILSIILIPRFQIIGAAVAYSSIYAVSFAIVYYYARMFGISCHNMKTLSKIWVSAILVFAVAFMMHTYLFSGSIPILQTGLSGKMYGLIQALVISAVSLTVYFISIRLTSTLKESDLEMLFSVMPRRLTALKPLASWVLIRSSQRKQPDYDT